MPLRTSTLTLGTVLLALASLGGCGVGDQECTPDSLAGDKDDGCPYGPPGGPKPPVSDCPDIPQGSAADCATPKTFIADVFPILRTVDANTAGCGIATCHGDEKSFVRVFLPPSDALATYDSLTSYEGSQKYPYVNAVDPKHSWMLCNLQDPPGVGQVMPSPPGTITLGDIEIIREWLSCGAQFGDDSGAGGAGGGGAGGAPGAGGSAG